VPTIKMVFGTAVLLSALDACGGSSDVVCCTSGYYYDCPSTDSANQCSGGHPEGCTRDATKDNLCQSQ